ILSQNYITNCKDVYNYLKTYYKGMKNEEFKVLYLNTKNIILYEESLFTGTVNEAKVYIRKIIEQTIRFSACAIIIVHNHPSGNLKPSQDDILITERIKQALSLIEVKLLDHIIVGDNDYFTFVGEHLL
ncbi:MAG: JAB domain-containing protein, partial [Candidatus Cloacimonetes bacterium]|nr:JAB domain-containing protein [Candidatus Cloacimonadota bacterium]